MVKTLNMINTESWVIAVQNNELQEFLTEVAKVMKLFRYRGSGTGVTPRLRGLLMLKKPWLELGTSYPVFWAVGATVVNAVMEHVTEHAVALEDVGEHRYTNVDGVVTGESTIGVVAILVSPGTRRSMVAPDVAAKGLTIFWQLAWPLDGKARAIKMGMMIMVVTCKIVLAVHGDLRVDVAAGGGLFPLLLPGLRRVFARPPRGHRSLQGSFLPNSRASC